MHTVHIQEATTHLARSVDQAAAGEEILLARAGKPVARLVALASPNGQPRALGLGRGRFTLPKDFDALDREAIARMFAPSAYSDGRSHSPARHQHPPGCPHRP